MQKPFLQCLLERVSAKLGARVFFADQFGYAGFIEFENGSRRFFKGTSFDINPQGASRIATDKDYCAKILKHLGYRVPDGILIFSPQYRGSAERGRPEFYSQLPGLEAAVERANDWGFPLFVKPNDESEGTGVSRVYDRRQLVDDIQNLFSWTERVLVQKPVAGADLRVVVLDGQVLSAYQRLPFQIKTDGRSSIRSLVDQRIEELRACDRGKKFERDDPRIWRELKFRGLSFESVVAAGEVLTLLPNANLSTGGHVVDLTDSLDVKYKQFCISITQDMGLRLCGVDLLVFDPARLPNEATVLEINSAPGLNNFATTGAEQSTRVEALYERILIQLRDA